MSVNSGQVGGEHYKSEYQHWDFVHLCLDDRYLEGNLTKYVARHTKKNGVQDLKKAVHYLEKLVALNAANQMHPLVAGRWMARYESPAHFCDVNQFNPLERTIIIRVASWRTAADLKEISSLLDTLVNREEKSARQLEGLKAGAPIRAADLDMRAGEPGSGYVDQG